MKVVNLILAVLFLLFASFQFNDPDPYLWVILYVSVAGVLGFAAFGRQQRYLTLAGIAVTLVGCLLNIKSVFQFFFNDDGIGLAQGMSDEYLYIEESREFGGMFIALLALAYVWWQFNRKRA